MAICPVPRLIAVLMINHKNIVIIIIVSY